MKGVCTRKYQSKWKVPVTEALDKFWKENHYPPAIRDIMEMTGITSTSVCRYILTRIPDVRFTQHNKPIPKWVDDLFEEKKAHESIPQT